VREVRRLVDDPIAIATAGVLPADVPAYLETAAAAARVAGVRLAAVAHAGRGVVTLILAATGAEPPPAAATIEVLTRCRDAARVHAGQLVLEWAPLGVREACPVWDEVPGPAITLMRGLKARLDPHGVLNPGRFVGGI
jgi:glycolate oxidase FAD binding subunit